MSIFLITGNIDIAPLLKAQKFLDQSIQEAQSQLEKAGTIQAFEFCYELAWKIMKRILAYRGIQMASPREVFRAAALEKLIDDPEIWFAFIQQKNLTVHVYNQELADNLFSQLPHFSRELNRFIQTIKKLSDAP